MAPIRRDFPSQATLIEALALVVTDVLTEAAALKDTVGLVVSGGRTPGDLFAALTAKAAPWAQTVVTLADERWVPPTDPASNEALVRRTLLQGAAAEARFIPLYCGAPTPEDGAAATTQALAEMPRPVDLVLLGMGDDGHTASLFPGAPELTAGLEEDVVCLAVNPPNIAPPRLSLSLATLLSSQRIVVLMTGETKRAVLETALNEGAVKDMPIRAVLHQNQVPVEIFWAP